MEWNDVDPTAVFEAIRDRGPGPEAERTVWAFERALAVARVDAGLLWHLLAATVSLVAVEEGQTPRGILEQTFRRSIGDAEWQERFAPLFG